MPEPAILLALVMVAALTLYALLGGADYGGGVWDLLATGRTARAQRDTIARAIAPVWEANHVWLILVVTVLFSGFPRAFAELSISLHLPLALALLGIVMRGSAFVFRAYGPATEGFSRVWGMVFAVSSTITPVLLGVTVGALTEGGAVFTPFTLAVGLFALVLFAYLAAVYLALEAQEEDTREAFRWRALIAGLLAGALALTVFVLSSHAPHVREGLTASAWALPLHAATATCAIAALVSLWARRYWWARPAAAAQVALIVWGWALAQYPYLIRPDVTIASSAAPRPVLVLLLQVLVLGAIVLIPSLLYLFHVFAPTDRWPTARRQA
jgi:cytochrome d ubiquinol oxidase subunit II